MTVTSRLMLLTLALGLGACTVQRPVSEPVPEPLPPIQTAPASKPPASKPPASKPTPPAPAQRPAPRTSASFAPPPSGPSHWDQGLGVYVLDNQPGVYYRQRTYYRWNNGWSWATSPAGPWEATDSSGVPPGLGRQHP
ncbi:hypothetical protein [Pseudomonas massiliensis]|uniref:hypothetical protein n=1 Tax=Pseudomonas massiliensis TaxID=522492 RepID=UPI00058B2D70|nr:hypothetical protein [Pseudomonas massiliensis]